MTNLLGAAASRLDKRLGVASDNFGRVFADQRMIGKRVQFDDETWAAINLLRQERRRSFQQLANEAFKDLLEKHHHPVGLKAQLRESMHEEKPTKSTPEKKR